MALADDVAALKASNEADAATLATLEADLATSAPSASDGVVAALVAALEAAGYTVTAPLAVEAAAPAETPAA